MNGSEEVAYQSMLSELRIQLNAVDEDLIKLLVSRFSLTNEIGKLKQINNQPIYDQIRERAIIQSLSESIRKIFDTSGGKLNQNKLTELDIDRLVASIAEIYLEIMNQSKICQSVLTLKE